MSNECQFVIGYDILQEVDEITEDEIAAVAERTSEKVYNTNLVRGDFLPSSAVY